MSLAVWWWLFGLFFLICNYKRGYCKGKHKIGDVFSTESKEKMSIVAPVELGGRKANLATDMQS